MEPASNIPELVNLLDPWQPLQHGDRNLYVPIFDGVIEDLRDSVLYDAKHTQTRFVAGQPGTGKTTALNFVADEVVRANFSVRFIRAKEAIDIADVDIIDVLLILAFKLVEGHPILEPHLLEKLLNLQRAEEGVVTEPRENERLAPRKQAQDAEDEGTRQKPMIRFNQRFFTRLFQDKTYRQMARDAFRLKKSDLLDLVNDLILEYELQSKGRRVLLILDDLEKIQAQPQIKRLFGDDRQFLLGLRCKKIITIPVHLAFRPESLSVNQEIHKIGLTLNVNPTTEGDLAECPTNSEANKKILRQILRNRMAADADLVSDDAIDEAIHYSGGILRQYLAILHAAARDARRQAGVRVDREHVVRGRRKLADIQARTITSLSQIQFLEGVRLKNIPSSLESKSFVEALLSNQIVSCQSGVPSYIVNPLIENTVRVCAARENASP
ncbi:hypothetical protein SCOR_03960 [Sulfidibacter corallicola]|uniref:Uncharacterized protein n=1 Tax=Sulfidibacter corallicola TaxID=2818388 RepID=A0A8A4TFL0_SULCO|nr:hypothetical protein [Sulfidibacter corallicola]QTD48317.1 hypothetical protein J3U87_22285 [Sulfidibacter corallicola]